MNKIEQQISIAKACNLDFLYPLKRRDRKGKDDPNGVVLWYCAEAFGGSQIWAKVPDYLNDLNAMHEAEKAISRKRTRRDCYVQNLDLVMERDRGFSGDCLEGRFWFAGATALQRAEAFLRTLNLWTPTREENERDT